MSSDRDQCIQESKAKKSWLRRLGPGLVTGASDDDPSGVAVYSQAGAALGMKLLWVLPICIPLMAAVQEISARIGRTTGRGIGANLRRVYPAWIAYPIVFLMAVANIFNLGADIGVMGEATGLVIGGSALLYCVLFTIPCVVLQVFVKYERYVKYLKWLSLTLLAYVAVLFMGHVHWGEVARSFFPPTLSLRSADISLTVAVLGTTISPFLFFWQASLETEEVQSKCEAEPLRKAPEQAPQQLHRIRVDTYVGMGFSQVIAMCILMAVAATLHAAGTTKIDTAAQAAEALRPVAGKGASTIFTLGIIGTGLLAVPSLAGAAAYGIGGLLHWRTGLTRKPSEAKWFYAVIAAATVLGLGINLPWIAKPLHLTPIWALYWSAIVNGIVSVPCLALVVHMAGSEKVMGPLARMSPWLRVVGWIATAVMALAAVAMFAVPGQ